MIQSEGGKDPNHPSMSLSLAAHPSTFTSWHATGYQTPRSPSYLPSQSLSPNRRSRGPYHDQGHILPIPVRRVLAAQAQPSQGLTLGHLGVTPTILSNTAPVPQTSS